MIAHPGQRPPRRSASASDASRDAARIRRNARSAVVSSSTPGVLHTAMPRSAGGGDVDVVVADGDVGDHLHAAAGRGRVEHAASIRSVSRQTTASTSATAARSSSGVKGVSSARCTISCPAASERIEAAVGQLAGDEDAGHRPRPGSVLGVVDLAPRPHADREAKQWIGAWSDTGRRLCTRSAGCARGHPGGSRAPRPRSS